VKNKSIYILLLITFIGAMLRFWDLGSNPLWIDESLFAWWQKYSMFLQEFPPIIIANVFQFESEFWLRFMFALAGTLTIPAIYLVVKNHKLEVSIIVAIFPLFVFWSRMARPYAFAGLFLVLGWRWWYFSIISILTTPFSLLGVKVWKQNKWVVLSLLALTLFMYFIRPDSGAEKTVFEYRTRLLYLPALALLLYITEYNWNYKIFKRFDLRLALFTIIIIVSLTFIPANKYQQWYSAETGYSDWRGHPAYMFSTNAHLNAWYSGGYCLELKEKFMPLLKNKFNNGETITLGLDYYALRDNYYQEVIPKDIIKHFKNELLGGKVIGVAINKKGWKRIYAN
jgi:hypothetical protein